MFRSRIKDFALVTLLLFPHIGATFVVLSFLYSFSWYTFIVAIAVSFTNILVLAFLFEAPSIFTRILLSDFKNTWRDHFWTTVDARLTKTNSHPITYNVPEIEDWCKKNCVKRWDRGNILTASNQTFRFKNKRDAIFFKTVWR